eukprot:m.371515 g.371515  ORF g.371515 m.371515 type:complete len:583 (-) comp28131_c0_seq1:5042-6790(-)
MAGAGGESTRLSLRSRRSVQLCLGPHLLLLHLRALVLDGKVDHLLGERVVNRRVRTRLPGCCHLHDLAAGESINDISHLGPVDAIDTVLQSNRSCVAVRRHDALLKVLLQEPHALVLARQRKLDRLVHPVQDGRVNRVRLVGCKYQHDVLARRPRAIQECAQCVPHALTHLTITLEPSFPQERVGFVDKQECSATGCFCPVKDLVQLGNSARSQRSNVTSREDGVVKTTLLGETRRKKRLPRAWRTVQHHVPECGTILPRVCSSDREILHPLLKSRLEHNAVEGSAIHLFEDLSDRLDRVGPPRRARCVTNKRRLDELVCDVLARDAGTHAGTIHACSDGGDYPDSRCHLGRVCQERGNTVANDSPGLPNPLHHCDAVLRGPHHQLRIANITVLPLLLRRCNPLGLSLDLLSVTIKRRLVLHRSTFLPLLLLYCLQVHLSLTLVCILLLLQCLLVALSCDLIFTLQLLLVHLHVVLHRLALLLALDTRHILLLLLGARGRRLRVGVELLLPCPLLHSHQLDQVRRIRVAFQLDRCLGNSLNDRGIEHIGIDVFWVSSTAECTRQCVGLRCLDVLGHDRCLRC